MMNDAENDLRRYCKTALQFSAFLFGSIFIALINAWNLGWEDVQTHLLGGALGALLATINLFALGFAFYGLVIKKMRRWVVFVPMATFILMCVTSFYVALYSFNYIFGFALGLTVPVLFGMVIIFGSSKPA